MMFVPQLPKGKILLVTCDYPPSVGGVAWYYYNLVCRLNVAETPTVSPLARERLRGGNARVTVLVLGQWALTLWWPLLAIPLILNTIKLKTNHWWVGQVLPVGTIVWLLSFFWRKSYIVSTHGMDVLVPWRSRRKRWLVRKILTRAALITTNSEWTKRKIIEHYFSSTKYKVQSSKFVVVYPEPKPTREVTQNEITALRVRLNIPHGAKILLTVSRLVARKGIDRVLRALPFVWRSMPSLHYVIVGEGEERSSLRSLVDSYQQENSKKIHLVGKVTDDELPVYYNLADTFILLPRETNGDVEGFGIVYLEADQYGMPVIGCGSGGSAEALSQCRTVIHVEDPDNLDEVTQKICQIFQ